MASMKLHNLFMVSKQGRADFKTYMITKKSLVDFHCHLDLFPDFQKVILDTEEAGVYTLAVTTTPRAWAHNYELTQATRYVRAALGLHPQLVAERAGEMSIWEVYLDKTRYIGEVGLDAGPRFYNSINLQKQVFEGILRCCAAAGNKIISVHSFRATTLVLDYIEKYLPPNQGKIVLHWFTGTKKEAKRAVDMGCYFSINASMLNNINHASMIATIPLDMLLTETDGPFIKIGTRHSKPTDVALVVEALGKMHSLPFNKTREKILKNLRSLLSKEDAPEADNGSGVPI